MKMAKALNTLHIKKYNHMHVNIQLGLTCLMNLFTSMSIITNLMKNTLAIG